MIPITVLIATYNGEQYINAQLESLVNQTYPLSQIIVSDDGSTDGTLTLLKSWQRNYPSLIHIEKNASGNSGHAGNFANLCQLAKGTDSECFLFCDQDDVWHPEKVEKLVRRYLVEKNKLSEELPILVHSDLTVVDEQLNEMATSLFKYQGLPSPLKHCYPKLLVQNNVTGCASLFNRRLLELATPIPQTVQVHDWWFAQLAQAIGIIAFVDEPLVKYRQHGMNAIGAKESTVKVKRRGIQIAYFELSFYRSLTFFYKHIKKSIGQIEALFKRLRKSNHSIRDKWIGGREELALERDFRSCWRLAKQLAGHPKVYHEVIIVFMVLYFRKKNPNGYE